MGQLIAGVDESGRGCVLGPLVLCVASIAEEREPELKRMGAKDSKLLSPALREALCPKLKRKLCGFATVHVTAEDLNRLMPRHSLNDIEAMKIAEGVRLLKEPPDRLFADSPDTVAHRFAATINRFLPRNMEIVSEHKADRNYPIVSAASVIAKVERDAAIREIKREWGVDFGSGYCHDPKTIEFLKSNLGRPEITKHVRKRWETVARLSQKSLCDFG